MSKRVTSQSNSVIINAFEYIQYVNIYKDMWADDDTFFTLINRQVPTLRGLNIECKTLNLDLTKKYKEEFDNFTISNQLMVYRYPTSRVNFYQNTRTKF